ncbi:hypothetical protein MBLNU459_g0285t1 [Dothideomycetes sp. NU459]
MAGKLPTHMQAQFLDQFNMPYSLRTVPLPQTTGPHDLLIKVEAASYCHTDAVLAAGSMHPFPPTFPHIGCHEFAGTIVAHHHAADRAATRFQIGDRVGVPGRAYHPCGECFECKDTTSPDSDPAGYSVYCPHAQNHGISGPGGFREYAVVDARQVTLIPETLSAIDTAPLMCAGVTIYGALKRCALQPGQRVGIMGCGGGLGHLGLQFATKMGLKVVGVDNADGPLHLARGLDTGAMVVDARIESAEEILQRIGAEDSKKEKGEVGLDAVLILPESQGAFDYGMQLLRNHGKCVVVSFPAQGFHISASDIVFRDISVVGSLVGSNKVLTEMLKTAARYRIRAVSKSFSLEDLNQLVEEYHKGGGGKLVVDMSSR